MFCKYKPGLLLVLPLVVVHVLPLVLVGPLVLNPESETGQLYVQIMNT